MRTASPTLSASSPPDRPHAIAGRASVSTRQSKRRPLPPGKGAELGALASRSNRSQPVAARSAATISATVATPAARQIALPVRARRASSRSRDSLPWSWRMSRNGAAASTSASSGSTKTPTLATVGGTRAARPAARSGVASPRADRRVERLGRRQPADLDVSHRLARIACAAAAGSFAAVIGRPMTSIEAPDASAACGVPLRFWSPDSAPAGRMPGTTK